MDDITVKLARNRNFQVIILQIILVLYFLVFLRTVYKESKTKDDVARHEVVRVHRSLNANETIFAFISGIASTVSISVGLAVYYYLPKMRNNVHGRIRIYFMSSQLVIGLSNSSMAFLDNFGYAPRGPLLEAVALLLPRISSLVYCAWLTVMGFLTWNTFSKPLQVSGASGTPRQLFYCCLFAWGFPGLLFIFQQICLFLFDFYIVNSLTLTWNFTIPINIVMIVSTIINLKLHNSAKTSAQSSRTGNTEEIIMYIKLASIAGVDWSILCVGMIAKSNFFMFIGYSILLLQGSFQFALFTCNSRVLALYKEKRNGIM